VVLPLALKLFALLVFFLVNTVNIVAIVLAARTMLLFGGRERTLSETVLTRAEAYLPVSFLIPAYNEEATIVSSLKSLLAMHYPEFEVIVANDGSKDDTLAVLTSAFELVRAEPSPRRFAPHADVRGAYRSRSYPNLLVVDKANGGRADAINAALEQAHYPLVVITDADSLIDPAALMKIGTRFMDAPELRGVGGTIRVVNEADVVGGAVTRPRSPRNFIARWQQLEYIRAFMAARTAMSAAGCLISISGAFGIFRRASLIEVGGLRVDTVGEDLELTFRLHRHYRDRHEAYRLEFLPEPVCWTQVPETAKVLGGQRDRWHRGLWETLWRHRDMLFRPRYGRIGLVAVPYVWLVEGITPIMEVLGYLIILVLAILGALDAAFVLAFLGLTVFYGMVVGLASAALDQALPHSPRGAGDRYRLMVAILTENLGYRQWLAVVRVVAMFKIRSSRGKWGVMTRRGFE